MNKPSSLQQRGLPAQQLDVSRRLFMRHASAMGALAGAGAPLALNLLAAGTAAAQTAGDYKALVCIFLFGGNDAYNMVLSTEGANGAAAATASSSWDAYVATRNQAPDSIALLAPGVAALGSAAVGSPARLGGVLPISPLTTTGANAGRSFALHPVMGSLRTMFDTDRRLAILPNIGPLIAPTTKTQYGQRSHPKPASLFSAGLGARRRHARLGRAHGRHRGFDEHPQRLHVGLGFRQRDLAGRAKRSAVPGGHRRRHPPGG
jgi:uncharacterized protein (DUF1501 family)